MVRESESGSFQLEFSYLKPRKSVFDQEIFESIPIRKRGLFIQQARDLRLRLKESDEYLRYERHIPDLKDQSVLVDLTYSDYPIIKKLIKSFRKKISYPIRFNYLIDSFLKGIEDSCVNIQKAINDDRIRNDYPVNYEFAWAIYLGSDPINVNFESNGEPKIEQSASVLTFESWIEIILLELNARRDSLAEIEISKLDPINPYARVTNDPVRKVKKKDARKWAKMREAELIREPKS